MRSSEAQLYINMKWIDDETDKPMRMVVTTTMIQETLIVEKPLISCWLPGVVRMEGTVP